MSDKLKQAALLFKSKLKNDEVQELLIRATSQQNWQTSTKILHQIANAAYNYEQWQKISAFIWQKLKSQKWVKILKTLNLIQFLLRNGPPNIIGTFKYQIYQFKGFSNYKCYDEGIDRGEAIRQKSKILTELLSNDQLLEQQRIKAKNIKQKLSNLIGEGKISNESTGKYQGYSNKTANDIPQQKNSSLTIGTSVYGQNTKSAIDKYKTPVGGSIYSKQNLKQKLKQKQKEKQQQIQQKKQEEVKKPFQKKAPKLSKPGQSKPISQIPAINITGTLNNKNTTNINNIAKIQSKSTKQEGSVDIFQFQQQNIQPIHAGKQPAQINTQTTIQNIIPTAQSPYINNNYTQINYNQTQKQQYPVSHPQDMFIQQPPNYTNPIYPITSGVASLSLNHPQNNLNKISNTQNTNFLGISKPIQAPRTLQANNFQYNMPTQNNSNSKKKQQDQFGVFQSANKEVKWLSKQEKSLIDLNDLGFQVKQKKIEQAAKQTKQPIKKQQSQGSLLATQQDFQHFLGINTNSFNSQTANNLNFGVISQGNAYTSSVINQQITSFGNFSGYPNTQNPYNQFRYPQQTNPLNYQMNPQQYQQYVYQQQQLNFQKNKI